MKGKSKYGKPDSADFLRYMKGEMTEAERHSFERELQKNPFAQEAMDGMETIPARDVQHDLGSLRQRLNQSSNRRKRYTYYRIAASVAVLMIISSVFIVVERSSGPEKASLPEYMPVPIEIQKAEPVRKPENEELAEPMPSTPAPSLQKKASRGAESAASRDLAGGATAKPERPEPVQEPHLFAEKKIVDELPVFIEEAAAALPAAVARSRMKTDTGILTALEPVEPARMEMAIYEDRLNSKESADSAGGYLPPQPSAGRDEYERYIRENIIRPDSATTGQRVVVVAAFRVLMDGSLDSIRIVRSPGQKFSDEALRLISTGPSWKPATRNGVPVEDEVSLRIVFR